VIVVEGIDWIRLRRAVIGGLTKPKRDIIYGRPGLANGTRDIHLEPNPS
jgi:hypothetical protein